MSNYDLFLSIDPEYYRHIYEDFREKNDNELLIYYHSFGEAEGHIASPYASQDVIVVNYKF
jgi:hypothetical protein